MQLDHEKEKTDAKSRELSSEDTHVHVEERNAHRPLVLAVAQAQDDGKMDRAVAGQIKNRIHDVLKEENDWEQFKIHFEEVQSLVLQEAQGATSGADGQRAAPVRLLQDEHTQ